MSDTLPDKKMRVEYKHLQYPYLYAGDSPQVTRAYGPQATPHVFIFHKSRRLRYLVRFANSYRVEKVNTHDTQNAIDALLAGKEVAVKETGTFGCSTKWHEKASDTCSQRAAMPAGSGFLTHRRPRRSRCAPFG